MSNWSRTNSDWKLLDYHQKVMKPDAKQIIEASSISNMDIFKTSYIMYEFVYQRNSRQIESLWQSGQNFIKMTFMLIFTFTKAYSVSFCHLYFKCSLYGPARWCRSTWVFDHYYSSFDDFTIDDFTRTSKCARTEFGANCHQTL